MTEGILLAVRARVQGQLPELDADCFVRRFPTLESIFDASRSELAEGLGVGDGASEEYCIVLQRLMLWENPDEVLNRVVPKTEAIIRQMPRSLADFEGASGRDPLDPLVFALASRLLGSGPTELLRTMIAHKCLMKLENLIGVLHQEVLGSIAGCERVLEPRIGESGTASKRLWHPEHNPYPGFDVLRRINGLELYQLKNKTGSSQGSAGNFLGAQFGEMRERYPRSRRFYVSMVGRSLSGHRSMGAVIRADPEVEVLVGLQAFQQLGLHRDTPEIVMEMYLEVFETALENADYDFEKVLTGVAAAWMAKHGDEDPCYAMLEATVSPLPSDPDGALQSSRTYVRAMNAKRIKPE